MRKSSETEEPTIELGEVTWVTPGGEAMWQRLLEGKGAPRDLVLVLAPTVGAAEAWRVGLNQHKATETNLFPRGLKLQPMQMILVRHVRDIRDMQTAGYPRVFTAGFWRTPNAPEIRRYLRALDVGETNLLPLKLSGGRQQRRRS